MGLLGGSGARYALQAVAGAALGGRVWGLSESNLEWVSNYVDRRGMKNQLRLLMLFVLVLGVSHVLVSVRLRRPWCCTR